MNRRTTWLGSAALAAAAVSAASCGGSVETNLWNTGGAGSTTGSNTGGADTGGTGGDAVCMPGATKPCYTGPAGTKNVGLCAEGTSTCEADSGDWGPCVGEITPVPETCLTTGDDDCNGQANEGGAGCVCVPGSTQPCYSGPAETQGVGICKAGVQTCDPTGTAHGPCVGEVLPAVEDCKTAADENCDGQTPPCGDTPPIIDLRADVNRNGTVDLADPTEDTGEDVWTAARGAIFLANIDDDQKSCPAGSQSDAQLAACNDAADEVVNGAADLGDLARLKTVPWPKAPADASATVSVSSPGASYVRLFKNNGGTFSVFNPATTITSAELSAGVELAIEGKDIIRDSAVWDGKVKITLNVHAGTGTSGPLPDGSDTVEMRMSPVIFRHHLDEAQTIYASKLTGTSSTVFRADLSAAAAAAGVANPLYEIAASDQWTQDYFETAYMSMPAPGGGQKVIHVNFRSANYTGGGLRSAGRTVYTVLRGSDVAGATVYDPNHSNSMDTLNSFGNLETIPPYTKNGTTLTLGKVLRGSVPTWYPDKTFDKMITSQSVQGVFYLDTSWLLVGHVDETVSFIKAPTAHGWAMLVADNTLGRTLLEQAAAQGFGSTPMFAGKYWLGNTPAQVTIDQVLADTDVMNTSAWAAVQVDGQVEAIKQETGLTDAELIRVASLFESASGRAVAYVPGMVNGIYLSDTDFGPPDPHGPVIGGQDIYKTQLEDALVPYGINARWIEDWDLYHRLDGEVHCGSNTTRAVPANIKWWESGL